MASTQIPFTFGVELEFAICARNPKPGKGIDPIDGKDPRPIDFPRIEDSVAPKLRTPHAHSLRDDIYIAVGKALTAAGIQAGYRPRLTDDDDNTGPFVPATPWDKAHTQYRGSPAAWHIKSDMSIAGPDGRKTGVYRYWEVEVISPPLWFSEQALAEVHKVCEVLTTNFRCHVNPSMGLHVHVGRGTRGFMPEEYRNLLAMLWTFEPLITKRVHPGRRTKNDDFCKPIRKLFCAKRAFTFDESCSGLFNQVRSLLQDENNAADKIIKLTRHDLLGQFPKFATYNFCNMNPDMEERKNTVEFRQHESTLDGVRITHWVKLVVGIVNYACAVDRSTLLKLLHPSISHEAKGHGELLDIEQFLSAIGVPKDVSDFYAVWSTTALPGINKEKFIYTGGECGNASSGISWQNSPSTEIMVPVPDGEESENYGNMNGNWNRDGQRWTSHEFLSFTAHRKQGRGALGSYPPSGAEGRSAPVGLGISGIDRADMTAASSRVVAGHSKVSGERQTGHADAEIKDGSDLQDDNGVALGAFKILDVRSGAGRSSFDQSSRAWDSPD
jgi:hypothetical protein